MSRFTGPQYKGASRDAKATRREEAEQRQAAHRAFWGHIDGSWPRTDPARNGRKLREALARADAGITS